jgi:hypothetical protein
MNIYTFVVSLHVIVAILGLGPLMALALLTKRPPFPAGVARPMPPEPALRAFLRLLRISQVSLGLMFVTGATLIALVHGAFGRQWWMIVSVALFAVLGGGTGVAQSCFKKALKPAGSVVHVERAHLALVAMCAIVPVIAWLMQSKPF